MIDEAASAAADGSSSTDFFVFTCGPWLGTLFPDIVGSLVTPTRQVCCFGVPAGDVRFASPALPVWLNAASNSRGMPADDGHGFKFADDTPGRRHRSDRTSGADDGRRRAREPVSGRPIPRSPWCASRRLEVCQYESTRTRISSSTVILVSPASGSPAAAPPRLQDGTSHWRNPGRAGAGEPSDPDSRLDRFEHLRQGLGASSGS